VSANLQYGLSLGKNPIDKATYAAASVAADVFKMVVPMLALSLWSKRFHILAIAGLTFVAWLRRLVDDVSCGVCTVEPWRGDC